ncbi:hypothetical protein IGI82_001941 [Enterococcus sp. AZ067]|nr:hypothetical protein A5882_002539 [Enterococcus sp. 4E1_DIV0656]
MQAASEADGKKESVSKGYVDGTHKQRFSDQKTVWIGGAYVKQTAKIILST